MSNLNENDNDIILKPNINKKRKRQNIKRGILGYPKKNRILYFFNNSENNVSFNIDFLNYFIIIKF